MGRATLVWVNTSNIQAHPTACTAAIAVQEIIKKERLLENVIAIGHKLGNLQELELRPRELVGDVRDRSLFSSVEFMRDKHDKIPFELDSGFYSEVIVRGLELGIWQDARGARGASHGCDRGGAATEACAPETGRGCEQGFRVRWSQ